MDKGSLDIVVLNAMLFSAFSAIISILTEMSRFVKSPSNSDEPHDSICHLIVHLKRQTFDAGPNGPIPDKNRKPHQLIIKCDKLKSIHQYTQDALEDVFHQFLFSKGIFISSDTIEVFHIIHIRRGIMCFIDIKDDKLVEQFNSFLSDKESPDIITFKQMFVDTLKLDTLSPNVEVSFDAPKTDAIDSMGTATTVTTAAATNITASENVTKKRQFHTGDDIKAKDVAKLAAYAETTQQNIVVANDVSEVPQEGNTTAQKENGEGEQPY